MKANELMIGDWVYNKHHGKNIRLTPYDFFTHTHNEFGEQELAPFAKPTIGRDLEPIPLTAEILEKNGFIDEMSNYAYRTDNYHVCYYCADERLSINKYGAILDVHCFYVHQLQHALRLCGIEKEIVV